MPFLSLRALWKGLKGNSLVFSIVFAMAVMGFSLAGILRSPLKSIGLWWPLMFILPIVAIGVSARFERRLKLEARFKRLLCLILIAGSIFLSVILWWYEGFLKERYARSIELGPAFKETADPVRRGPRNRP
jgi:hypothetical protein